MMLQAELKSKACLSASNTEIYQQERSKLVEQKQQVGRLPLVPVGDSKPDQRPMGSILYVTSFQPATIAYFPVI
jgi:hypothetical protein